MQVYQPFLVAAAPHDLGGHFGGKRLPGIRELDILPAGLQKRPIAAAFAAGTAPNAAQTPRQTLQPPSQPLARPSPAPAQPKTSVPVPGPKPVDTSAKSPQAKKDKEHARRSEKGWVQSEMGDDLECMGLNNHLGNSLYIQNRRCGLGHPKNSELSKQYAAKHLIACFAVFMATLKEESPLVLQRCMEQTRRQATRPHHDPMSVRHKYCEGGQEYPAQEEMQTLMNLMQSPQWQKEHTHPRFNADQLNRMTQEERETAILHDLLAAQRRMESSQGGATAKSSARPSRVEKKTSRKRTPVGSSRRNSFASVIVASDSAQSRYSTPSSELSVPSPLYTSFSSMGFPPA